MEEGDRSQRRRTASQGRPIGSPGAREPGRAAAGWISTSKTKRTHEIGGWQKRGKGIDQRRGGAVTHGVGGLEGAVDRVGTSLQER